MASMTAEAEAWRLPLSRPLTRADLADAPDDGHRYELIDGTLIVSPAPRLPHQRAVRRLLIELDAACTDGLEVLTAPFDVVLAEDTVVQPDVLVARTSDLTETDLPVAPVLIVEVLSPSTRRFDLVLKRSRFESAGVEHYWVVDPDEPSITAWTLVDGTYRDSLRAIGDEEFDAGRPFPVRITPSELVD
ncbi:Uma2 family endonuclease [Microlunatus sp. GCM10028923]|uniref:Uma2 family endonuclease n=1 Tax=Microlunatus sp. GCM10028923 TaxID=3273400 RepID=UPI00360A10E8